MKKKIATLLLVLCASLAFTGCNEQAKIDELMEDFDEAMKDGDYDEAKDILDEMKDIDSDNEDYKDAKKEWKEKSDNSNSSVSFSFGNSVDSQIQLCDTYRTAFTTACMDPEFAMHETFNTKEGTYSLKDAILSNGEVFQKIFTDYSGTDISTIDDNVMIYIENSNQFTVYIEGSSNPDTGYVIGSGPAIPMLSVPSASTE